jgi:hypothetical protein
MDIIQNIVDFFFILFLLVVLIFVVNFVRGFAQAKKEYDAKKAKDNLVEIDVETIMQGDKEVFFLYEAPHSSFICQAYSTEEIAKKIFERYKNKTIHLRQGGEVAIAYTFTE